MLRCFLSERFLDVSAWLRGIADDDVLGMRSCFPDGCAIGVAASIDRRLG
jgi:hypothetical protein